MRTAKATDPPRRPGECRLALEEIGDKRRELERLRAEAAEGILEWAPAARAAGLTVSEIAELAHFSRTSVHSVLAEGRLPNARARGD